MRNSKVAALFLALFAAAAAGPPSAQFTCATCHRAEAQTQPHTPMGMALELPPNQTVLAAHPRLTIEKHGYTYLIQHQGGVSTYTVSDATGSMTWPIRYAFGMHMQTFVLEHEGRFYESLVSYYPAVGGLAITMGSEGVRPHTLVEAMGRLLDAEEITNCFGCHSSGGVTAGTLHAEAARPGLDCEHCHAGADAHLEAMRQGKPGPMPAKLGAMAAEDMSNFCGQCHRTWDTVVRNRWWGSLNVRFQPYRLANSRCFIGNDPRIKCTSCHNPHQDLPRDDAAYDPACLACHGPAVRLKKVSTAGAPVPKPCPVAKSRCVSCHMAKVELPGSHSIFTDHDIRIVRPGDPYPN